MKHPTTILRVCIPSGVQCCLRGRGLFRCAGVLCLLLFGLLLCAAAAQAGRTVRVAFFPFRGFMEKLEDGSYTGYGYRYIQRIAETAGWDCQFVECSWGEGLDYLKQGRIDILGMVQKSPERETQFAFPKLQSGLSYATLSTRADSVLAYEDFPAFNGIRVGMMRGSIRNDNFADYSRANNFSCRSILYEEEWELDAALDRGDIDAIVSNSMRRPVNRRVIARFAPAPFYFVTRLDAPDILAELDRAQEAIKTSDPYYDMRLHDRFYRERPQDVVVFSQKEQKALRELGTLRVAYLDGWEPLASWDSGQPDGIAADVFRAIARETHTGCTFVRAGSYEEALGAVAAGKADAVCLAERGQRSPVSDGLQMTMPYMRVPIAKLSRIGNNPEHPASMALPRRFEDHLAYVQRSYFPDIRILRTASPREAIEALVEKKVDFAYTNIYTSNFLLSRPRFRGVAATSLVDYATEFSVGLSPRIDPTVVSAFNKVIGKLEAFEITNIIVANTAKSPSPTLSRVIEAHPVGAVSVFALVVGGMLCVFIAVVTMKTRTSRRIQNLLEHDQLTGLWNQHRFVAEGERRLHEGLRALVYIDVDSFKYINEMFGYTGGNDVLVSLAGKLRKFTGPGELVAKIAADHFVLLLRCEGPKELDARIRRLDGVLESVKCGEVGYNVLFSCGICVVRPGDTIVEVLDRAHYAKDAARRVHANTYTYFDESIVRTIRQEKLLEEAMNGALEHGDFIPYFQPKVDMFTGKLAGAEALARWRHGDRLIPPSEFIPLFEKNGFITKVDFHIYEETCRCVRELLDRGGQVVPVSCNFSRLHFLDQTFPDRLLSVAGQYGVSPGLIEIEVTETIAMDNENTTLDQVKRIKALGFRISIDDFGTGYSSLSLLCRFDMDMLKIDKVFLQQALLSDCNRELIECLVMTAGRLGITVLCEGVETEEQAAFLRSINCRLAQGFLYDKPLPKDAFFTRWVNPA